MPVLRTAVAEDIAGCTTLLEILFSQEKEFAPDSEAQSRGLAMIIENPGMGRIFVCEIDGEIQAMVLLLFTVSTFLGKKVALLEDMIVAPAWRTRGIGSLLVEHAIGFARKEGFGRITLLTDSDNEQAQQFYRAKGFSRSEMVVFRKVLEGETSIKSGETDTWMCRECGWLYDPKEGDSENNIKKGTTFERLSSDWCCPVCFTSKSDFDLFS
ncbi:GNAT family N-acetyltransferase [Chlorobium sp. KB01]|uniref:GNAT family N-acetyltransferase n=1 Tax=Chlorobium sp. KB01 TaxID=1917528 RepID=UPI0009778E03|nr:GNAT family N-acetyltransferase [Chlorobium sp. KB01]